MPSLALPPADELHLWVTWPQAPGLPAEVYEAWLAPEERDRYRRYRFPEHRREYLVTRALVRSVLSEYAPQDPADWRFSANPYGKPETVPPGRLQFNLSNSPDLAVCLVGTRGPVGVDVEPDHRGEGIGEVAGEVFSDQELSGIQGLPDRNSRAARGLRLWTLKEAYVKARGLGLTLPLKHFSWVFGPGETLDLTMDPRAEDDPGRWWFGTVRLGTHQGALVAEGPGPVRLKVFSTLPGVSAPRLIRDQVLDRGFTDLDLGPHLTANPGE